MKIRNIFRILILLLLSISCSHKNISKKRADFTTKLNSDKFNLEGTYFWKFKIMGTEQTSIHNFFSDSINYEMNGRVYNTKYSLQKLSYEEKNKKWIGEGKNGVVYVLFFKNKTKNSITIYKHKCKSKGLQEAINFQLPKPNSTNDHGWNIYTLNRINPNETLTVSGVFSNKNYKVFISDSNIKIGTKTIKKMSFHKGERRWVGKYKNKYLQLFFKDLNNPDSLQISINWFNHLEKLYKTKYTSITNWETYER